MGVGGGEEERSRVKKGKGARRVTAFFGVQSFLWLQKGGGGGGGVLLTGAVPSGNFFGLPV